MTKFGADVAQLNDLSKLFLRTAEALESSVSGVSSELQATRWTGPVAESFRERWTSFIVVGRSATQALQAAGSALDKHAIEQANLSAGGQLSGAQRAAGAAREGLTGSTFGSGLASAHRLMTREERADVRARLSATAPDALVRSVGERAESYLENLTQATNLFNDAALHADLSSQGKSGIAKSVMDIVVGEIPGPTGKAIQLTMKGTGLLNELADSEVRELRAAEIASGASFSMHLQEQLTQMRKEIRDNKDLVGEDLKRLVASGSEEGKLLQSEFVETGVALKEAKDVSLGRAFGFITAKYLANDLDDPVRNHYVLDVDSKGEVRNLEIVHSLGPGLDNKLSSLSLTDKRDFIAAMLTENPYGAVRVIREDNTLASLHSLRGDAGISASQAHEKMKQFLAGNVPLSDKFKVEHRRNLHE
jgi:hypothetical protein